MTGRSTLMRAGLASLVVIAATVLGVPDTAHAGASTGARPAGTWAKRVAADPDKGRPTTLTCLSQTFCVLADVYGAVLVEKHGVWQASYQLRPNLLVVDVSCVSTRFCVASGQNWTAETGFVMTYDGSTWTAPEFISPTTSIYGVSCVSPTFCMAVDYDGHYYTYDGTGWSPPRLVGDTYLDKVSCVSRTFCVAMDDLGDPYMYDGSTWTFYGGGDYEGWDLECLSTTWCVIASTYNVRTWDGTTWTYSDDFTQEALVSVSCASPRFCLAIGLYGGAYRFDGSRWQSTRRAGEDEPVAVTCLADKTCYETGNSGDVSRYSGGSWGDRVLADPRAGSPTSVSCPTDDFCMVVDLFGNSTVYRQGRWGPVHRHPFSGAAYVSCSSPTLCVVGDDSSQAFVFRGGRGSKPMQFAIGPFSGVSCTSTGFCAAVTSTGYAVTYDETIWSDPVRVLPRGSLTRVSCTSASFCLATKADGGTMAYDGQAWRRVGDAVDTPAALSCSSPTFCIALGHYGTYNTWNGTTWSHASYFVDSRVFDVSCPVDDFCQALAAGNDVYTYASGHWQRTQWLGSFAKGPYTMLSCTTTVTCTAIDEHGWARRYG